MTLANLPRAFLVCAAFAAACAMALGQEARRGTRAGVRTPAPGPWALKTCTNPILQKARRVDLRFAEPKEANQKEAERLYLQFTKEFPDDPLVPYIYYRLGHMYQDHVTEDLEKRGAVRDDSKALSYFQKVVSLYGEKDPVDDYLIGARVNIAALTPKREDKVAEYIAYYQWLCGLEVSGRKDISKGLLRTIREQKHGAAANMVAIADTDQHGTRTDLLNEIAMAFLEQEPGQLALARLKDQKTQ